MSPRPILKRSVSTEQHQQHQRHLHPNPSHAVHFPPSPALARTFTAHSATAYDRSPIVVSPNTCALPERGCPGRTYLLDEQGAPSPRRISCARDYHPRALAFASASSSNYPPVPPLIPDLSSESDESDGVSGLPGEIVSNQTFGPHGLAGPHSNGMNASKNNAINMNGYSPCDDNDALAFLPYAPSSPNFSHFPQDMNDDQLQKHKPRRRRDRRHESSVDPDRIPYSTEGDLSLGFSSLSVSPPSPMYAAPSHSHTRKKGVRNPMPMQLPPSGGFGFGATDDGCLGGF